MRTILRLRIDRSVNRAQDSAQSLKNGPEQLKKGPKMGLQTTFHAPGSGADFLGMRKSRAGSTEIVYDDGLKQRLIWRVSEGSGDQGVSDALQAAVGAQKVLASLYAELKKRAIQIERI